MSAVTDAAGRVVVFVHTLGDGLYRFDPSQGWALLGGAGSVLAVDAAVDAAGQAEVVALTTARQFAEFRPATGWQLMAGPESPAADFRAAGFDVVFAALADGAVYRRDGVYGWLALTSPGFAY